MFGGMTSERSQSQASLPPLESPYMVNASSRSVSFLKSPSPNERFQMYKIQEQIKTLQDEINRKDKLIDQMSKLELKNCPDKFLEQRFSPNRSICAEREEVAALNVKLDNLRIQLTETTNELQQKDSVTESMKKVNGELREEIARLQVALDNSCKQIHEYTEAKEAFETVRQRNNILINNLKDELTETQNNLMESRVNVKQLEDELVEITANRDEYKRQIVDLKESIMEITSDEIFSLNEIVTKIKTLLFENETSSNKILTLEEKLKSRDCEQQASRQTITRLVSKLSAEEAKNNDQEEKLNALKRELDQFKMSKSIIESDINSFECQIASLKKEIELLNQDNETKSKRIYELTNNTKVNYISDEQQNLMTQFINSLVSMLSVNYKTPSKDSMTIYEWIIGCVKSLLQNKDEASNIDPPSMYGTIDSLKSDLLELEKTNSKLSFENETQLRLTADDLKSRLKNTEGELLNASLTIDKLNCEKTKYYRILSELARIMNMNEINKDIGFDMIADALYARAVQLQQLEYETKTDHRLAEHSLTRKVKELKEKVHSKDLHIDLLHKKLTAMEGRQYNFETMGKERDKELLSNKKLAKHNQKLQEEIENLRAEIVDLKANLINFNKLQVTSLSLEQEVKSLTAKLDKLETVRQKQSKLLNDYKSSQSAKDSEMKEAKSKCDLAIASLNNELQLVKESLNDCKRKEKQMIETRAVVAKLLGLELDALAIPDFEIINRLERLIAAHQSNIYTQYSMETTLRDMNEGFFHEPCVLHQHHTHIIDEEPIYPKTKPNN